MDITSVPAGIQGWFGSVRRSFRLLISPCTWALVLLLLIPLQDSRPGSAQAAYDHARILFQHGRLADSQQEAEQGARQFQIADPTVASKFQLLEAEAMLFRGMYEDALRILAMYPTSSNPEGVVRKLTIEAVALIHQQQLSAADQRLSQADRLCKSADYATCGDVLRASGILAGKQGQLIEARQFFLESLSFAQAHHDRLLEASASLNLGWAALQIDHFDEAVDWSRSAYRAAKDLGAEDLVQLASGNLGWAYYQLGDSERALGLFLEAEESAKQLGDVRNEIKWLENIRVPSPGRRRRGTRGTQLPPGARFGQADR